MASKLHDSPVAAIEGVLFKGMTIMSGGFGLTGIPESLIPVIREAGTVVAEGKQADMFEGEDYIRETRLRADLSIVKRGERMPPES